MYLHYHSKIFPSRCVAERDKALCLGLLASVAGLFGFLPNPIIYGSVIDSSCLLWEQSCGERGSCWVYANDQLRYRFHGVTSACLIVAGVFETITYFQVKDLKLFDNWNWTQTLSANEFIVQLCVLHSSTHYFATRKSSSTPNCNFLMNVYKILSMSLSEIWFYMLYWLSRISHYLINLVESNTTEEMSDWYEKTRTNLQLQPEGLVIKSWNFHGKKPKQTRRLNETLYIHIDKANPFKGDDRNSCTSCW